MTIAMQPIYSVTVGSGGSGGIAFNNIPQTFTDLKVLTTIRDGRTDAAFSNVRFGLNSNSSSIFSSLNIFAVVGSSGSSVWTNMVATDYSLYCVGSVATANTFSNSEIYIPNYTGSNFKQVMMDNTVENNSAGTNANILLVNSSLFRSTSPITSMSFVPINGVFQQHSTFTLYGITKG